MMTEPYFNYYDSPLGKICIQACNAGLLGVWFEIQTTQPDNIGTKNKEHPIIKQTTQELTEYFDGKRQVFNIPLAAKGTFFQQLVWQALTTIPFASTWSYQDLANAINKPKAVRAVGNANAKNPISIIVPCHRVIGKNGALTGYAGGIECKKKLLILESKT